MKHEELIGKYCDLKDPVTGHLHLRGSKIVGIFVFSGQWDRPWGVKYKDEIFARLILFSSFMPAGTITYSIARLKECVNFRTQPPPERNSEKLEKTYEIIQSARKCDDA